MIKASARPDTWMPMYWGDYFKDTGHLTPLQHCAYLLMIGHYWTRGRALPDDDRQLAQIARQSTAAWKTMRPIIQEFFIVADGKWHHGRIEKELTKAFDFIGKQRENGLKGGRPRKPDVSQTKPTGSNWDTISGAVSKPNPNPDHKPEITTSPLEHESESSSSGISTDPARVAALPVAGSAPRAVGAGFRSVRDQMSSLVAEHRRKHAGEP